MSDPATTPAFRGTAHLRGLAETHADHIHTAGQLLAAADEIEQLRALVTRLTNVAQDLASGLTDPGTEALAAIHCGRHFIYG